MLMHARKMGLARRIVPLVLLISFTCVASLYPQFLEDEEEKAPEDIARGIKAESVSGARDGKCVIKISWGLNPKAAGSDFIVAKSASIIDTADKVRGAKVIITVKGAEKNSIDDADCAPGSYYYVVLSKKNIIENKMGLFRDANYTSAPVIIGAAGEEVIASGIRAVEIDKFKVRLTWKKSDKTGVFYYVYRSKQVINEQNRLTGADKLGIASDEGQFLDEGISKPGTYYYAVTARVLKGKENMTLVPNGNYTTDGVAVGLTAPAHIAITSISARLKKDFVLVEWNFSGSGGERMYRLFRSGKPLVKADEVQDGDVINELDISAREYRDPTPPPGKYYYGLIPVGAAGEGTVRLAPGVNITRNPVAIGEKKKKEEEIVETDDIDRILRRTFFRGKYRPAIKELLNLMKNTDNERVTAKAKLFIGRSNIELGEYRKALDYLFMPDVKKHYPKQADFWQVFALTRLRNY
jgi:hypothetical protein